MDLELSGRVVLITGGSKGIGLACAEAFLAEGARVAIASRDPANLESAVRALAEKGSVLAVQADLSRTADAVRMAKTVSERLGPIFTLVNSAGAAKRTHWREATPAAFQAAMDAKYTTYLNAMHAVAPGMVERRDGSIVNIVGMGGKVADPVHLPGGAANAALMLASVGFASAYAPHGVRVNAINPSFTLTGRVEERIKVEAAAAGTSAAAALEEKQCRIPMGRMAIPAEVAALVLFLASPRASYVTGAVIPMAGGANPMI